MPVYACCLGDDCNRLFKLEFNHLKGIEIKVPYYSVLKVEYEQNSFIEWHTNSPQHESGKSTSAKEGIQY